jgi:hypothetical protein
MADIVYAAPFAWDADKEEHIYCTDGLEEWPFIDVWWNPEFLAYYTPDENICKYGCCDDGTDCPPDVSGCSPCSKENYEYVTVPGTGIGACCPAEGSPPCTYLALKSLKGKVKVYLASSEQDTWIKVGNELTINNIAAEYASIGDAWVNAFKAFDDRSKIIESYNLAGAGSISVKESFRGFNCGVNPIFGYEGLPGATGYSSKATFEGFDIPPAVLAEQNTHNLDHSLYTTEYGLYFVAVGDITAEFKELCGSGVEDYEEIWAPTMVHAGLKEARIMDDNYRVCYRQLVLPAAECRSYEQSGGELPLELGASGPSSWNSPQKFRERALFTAAKKSCKYVMEHVSISGTSDISRQFFNPWTGVPEDAGEYVFKTL